MFKLTGILKKEEIREFTRKDGTQGKSKSLFIEPQGSVYPVKVNVSDVDLKVGKQGETITVEVAVFPYYIQDGKRKKAFTDFYIPNKK
ncbi:MAG TPA: hypothetical protein PKN54_02580 [Candidatus Cloacimonas acidaminovorans]|nr:hypothetical protein [Candidatus Cloacimonas acidaminovorans]